MTSYPAEGDVCSHIGAHLELCPFHQWDWHRLRLQCQTSILGITARTCQGYSCLFPTQAMKLLEPPQCSLTQVFLIVF